MRSTLYGAPGERLRVETIADPEPDPGEAVIRVARCGICGSDFHMTENET